MSTFKKIGVRCEGAACQKSAEMEVGEIPAAKEFDFWLKAQGFTLIEVVVNGVAEKRMLCTECTGKLSGLFK